MKMNLNQNPKQQKYAILLSLRNERELELRRI